VLKADTIDDNLQRMGMYRRARVSITANGAELDILRGMQPPIDIGF
jgi:hypothetical protein